MDSPTPFMPVPRPACAAISPEREAELRRAIVAEAKSWDGTPYVEQAGIKGKAVDCAMLLVRCWVDCGIFEPFDPRPYPPRWHMHNAEERYLGWLDALATRVDRPQPGDIAVYVFGRAFGHGGIVLAPNVLISASSLHRDCTMHDMDEAWLVWMNARSAHPVRRPVRYYDVFARLRA